MSYEPQTSGILNHIELKNIYNGLKGYGAISGMGLSVTGSSMVVTVASGVVFTASGRTEYAGGTVTLSAPHSTLPRMDAIIWDDSADAPAVLEGTATAESSTQPKPPAPDFADPNDLLLGVVYLPFNTSVIASANLFERQVNPTHVTTRSVWLPAGAFTSGMGSPDLAVRGSSASVWQKPPGWALDASSDEAVTLIAGMPTDYVAGDITLTAYLACPNGNAGVVRMFMNATYLEANSQIDQADDFVETDEVTVPGVAEQLFEYDETNLTFTATTQPVRFSVYRNASHGNDTYGSDVWFLGLKISYPSIR